MKTVTFLQKRHLPSAIWDPKNECLLLEFKNSQYTTSDKKIIELLTNMGYAIEGRDPIPSHLTPVGQEVQLDMSADVVTTPPVTNARGDIQEDPYKNDIRPRVSSPVQNKQKRVLNRRKKT